MREHNIKLIASDLDGTLLNKDKHLTDRTARALKALSKKGIIFVPATGRPLFSVPDYIKNFDAVKYIITSNGAATNKMPTGEEILSRTLSCDDIKNVCEIIHNKKIMIEVFSKGKAYTDKKFLDNLSLYGVTGMHADYTLSTRYPVENLMSALTKTTLPVENINLIFTDLSLRQEINLQIQQKNFAQITSSSPKNLEITSRFASKGSALKHICTLLGISMSETMCFGDGENDTDMLKECGYSFAMNNSSDYVKSFAKYTAQSCDEEGVAKVIENFILSS